MVFNELLEDDSEYHLTVQIQFDDKPEEVSWVLYDLTVNEVVVFVDFGEYLHEEFANKLLQIGITMDGPEEGEKQYAFTVYDKGQNGLCCNNGDGYYKVFSGDVEDNLELLGDDEFEFSSSYYFTLFEIEGQNAELETPPPTRRPSKRPTRRPSRKPTRRPTRRPTRQPTKEPTPFPTNYPDAVLTLNPITLRPTEPWEMRRSENMEAIGSRWNERTKTHPGVFTDVGGDQQKYKFIQDGTFTNAAPRDSLGRTRLLPGIMVVCLFVFSAW